MVDVYKNDKGKSIKDVNWCQNYYYFYNESDLYYILYKGTLAHSNYNNMYIVMTS